MIIRDFDAAETVPEKMSKVRDIKGVRGLVKLAKEIALTATNGNHDNEFIGKCQIALKVRCRLIGLTHLAPDSIYFNLSGHSGKWTNYVVRFGEEEQI